MFLELQMADVTHSPKVFQMYEMFEIGPGRAAEDINSGLNSTSLAARTIHIGGRGAWELPVVLPWFCSGAGRGPRGTESLLTLQSRPPSQVLGPHNRCEGDGRHEHLENCQDN